MTVPAWVGGRSQRARRQCQQMYGWTCHLCGKPITDPKDYSVDHVIPRSVAPALTWDPSNWRPAHLGKHPDLGCPGNRGRGTKPIASQSISRRW